MSTLVIKNVSLPLLKKQLKALYDLSYRERQKATEKRQTGRLTNAANLDALLDMLTDAGVHDE